MPERRKRELRPGAVDDLACREPPQQTSLEQIFMRTRSRLGDRRRRTERLLEREQSLEHADGRVKGGTDRATLGLAIPAPVRELFGEQSIDQPIAAHAEVGA